jgi:hypothetical protein
MLLRELHDGGVVGWIDHIHDLTHRLSTVAPDLLDQLLQPVLTAGAQHDFRALGGE